MENASVSYTHVLLVGLLEMKKLKYLYIVFYFCIYLSIFFFSSMIAVIIWTERSLHEPMYIYICNLIISGCIDILTFTFMAYDRYLAVGLPLRYPTLMTNHKTYQFIASMWICVYLTQIIFGIAVARLPLCDVNVINVFCDTTSLLKMSCSDTSVYHIVGSSVNVPLIVCCVSAVIYFYIRTFVVCLHISKDASHKAIHTLVTHLLAFSLFIVSAIFVIYRYRMNVADSHSLHLAIALVGLSVSMTANPLIYGLRTEALRVRIIKNVKITFSTDKLA